MFFLYVSWCFFHYKADKVVLLQIEYHVVKLLWQGCAYGICCVGCTLQFGYDLLPDVAHQEEVALDVDVFYHVVLHLHAYHEVANALYTSATDYVVTWVIAVDEFWGEIFFFDVCYLGYCVVI